MRRALALLAAAALAALALAGSAGAERASSAAHAYPAGLLDAGGLHACAVLGDGALACWGDDAYAQLGDDATRADQPVPVPVALPAGRTATAVAAGTAHTCAILDDGGVTCWGTDIFGVLGDDPTLADQPIPVPVALPVGRTATAVAADLYTACAILDDGSVACWGLSYFTSSTMPSLVPLPTGRRATAVTVGYPHACAILDDGTAMCWGPEASGELGDGTGTRTSYDPVAVALPPGRTAVALSAGVQTTCAVLDDGGAWCWGQDTFGQLGDDSTLAQKDVPVPVALPAGRTAVAITVGAGGSHACALLDDATVTCWGSNQYGTLGSGAPFGNQPTPVAVALPAGRGATALSAGAQFTCALLDDESVVCWGRGDDGRLGNGAAGSQPLASLAPRALSPGSIDTRAADVSLRLEGLPASLAPGASATATLRIANAGPDAATGLVVSLQPALLALAAGAPSQGAATATTWTVGTLAPGASATLGLTVTALAAGSGGLVAQVTAADLRDPDSTPGNGRQGDDDQATAPIAIASPPAPPPPPTPGKPAPDRLTLTLAKSTEPGRSGDTIASGRLVADDLAPDTACTGTVTLVGRTSTRKVIRRKLRLRNDDGACAYATTLAFTRLQRSKNPTLQLTVTFPGNKALLAATSPTRTLRLR